jgi:hypothetical protein
MKGRVEVAREKALQRPRTGFNIERAGKGIKGERGKEGKRWRREEGVDARVGTKAASP